MTRQSCSSYLAVAPIFQCPISSDFILFGISGTFERMNYFGKMDDDDDFNQAL